MAELIKYHNNFIQAIYSTDLIAKKLLVGISHKVQKIDKFGVEIEFNAKELADLTGISPNSIRKIEEATDKLESTKIRIKSANSNEWLSFNILAQSSYRKGKLTIVLPPAMRPFLMELKKLFTTYHIENIKPLRSEYSIRLYEMMCQFKSTGIFKIKVDELRERLGCKDKYPRFNNFRTYVLDQAKRDLKANCDIYFEYRIEKIGTVAYMIIFKIFRQQILKDSKLTEEDYREIYKSEKNEAIFALLTKDPTEIILQKYDEEYGENDFNYDNGQPLQTLMRVVLDKYFLNFPKFEEWKKQQK
jgi:plasmid replication initiation protein